MDQQFMEVADVERLVAELAEAISGSGFDPQVVVGLTRKGLYPAMRLAICLGVPGDRLGSLAAIKGADGRYVLTDLTQVRVRGMRVLAVDDGAVTNGLLPLVATYLMDAGADAVRTCVLNAETPGPDFVGRIGPTPRWYFERIPKRS